MSVFDQLDRIENKLDRLLKKVERQMSVLDDLQAEVEEQTTVIGSVETLLANLSQQLADAIAAGDMARVQTIKDQIDANTNRLSAAVVANTPTP